MKEMETLKSVGLFSSLSDEELQKIGQLLKERRYRKGNVIFQQGDVGDALYIVSSGRVKATIKDATGKERIIALYGEGDYFGEMALISGQTRSASMTVVGDARLLVLPKDAFEGFLASNLGVMRGMLEVMTRRVAEANLAAPKQEEEEKIKGKVIAVFSPKGGVGRTTVAVNLATALRQESGRPVALMDTCFPFGDVGVLVNLEPKKSVADLLPHINELDGEIMESIMQAHPSGVKVLLAPPTPEMAELVTADHINLILSCLRDLFEYIVVDTLGSFHEITLAILDTADLIIVLTTMEMPALKNVKVFLETAQALGYPKEKLALVLNRADSRGGISLADTEALVGQSFAATIVSDGRLATAAANRGEPFVLRDRESEISQNLLRLARLIAPSAQEEEEGEKKPKRRFSLAQLLKPRRGEGKPMGRPKMGDILYGLGNILLATAPLLFLGTLLATMGGIAKAGDVFNLFTWIGILGGTFFAGRARAQEVGGWLLGGILGGIYGILLAMSLWAILRAAGVELANPLGSLLYAILLYVILGVVGGLLGQLTRRQPKPLLSEG